MENRLRELRLELGLTLQEVADRLGTTPPTVSRLETGERELTFSWIEKFTEALGQPASVLIGEAAVSRVPVVGYVGAGEAIHWLTTEGDLGLDHVDTNFGDEELLAVEVRGDSMYPVYRDRDLVLCPARSTVDVSECLNRDCVVQTTSGTGYIKTLRAGAKKNRFRLSSYRAPDMDEVELAWATPVMWVRR
ncbi:MAG: helix-turn-helix domain-containing protein, partial [Myxococcota bacterium]